MKIQMPQEVHRILDILSFYGYDGYIVGGCVRDSILNKTPNDWDICTNCTPEKMLEIFSCFKVIPTGLKHGTLTVVINGQNYEVTTYRIDGEYINGRHPEQVEFTNNLKEDLKRRDFTINAMAYNNKEGLIDYYGGITDIFNKKIRCVGNPFERFSEDYLRMLRAIRFSAQLEYSLDAETSKEIKKLSKNIVDISEERIREELNKILMTDMPSRGLKLLSSTDLLKYIIPELEMCVGFQQHNPNHDKDVFSHILSVVDNTEKDLILRLAALFHDIGKPETFNLDEDGVGHFYKHNLKSSDITEEVMKRLKYDNKSIEQVVILVREHMSRYEKLRVKNTKKFINRVGIGNIERLFKLQIADINGSNKRDGVSKIFELKNEVERILNEKQPLSIKDLEINGYDLIQLGIPQGKQVGTVLNELMEIILENPELNRRDILTEIVMQKWI
ncbi:CCA tRNA nucleotidyltransferase [Alkaliphilus sp. MSJ-5]|uniref:CCA tRNA nucleotidyltransferase n=1 Tax=Alkaliphilus flagellatus TaxID=2841507 RepID=A0ABS6G863_9FIRM|nr:CCA tRNA nucleotidyltransferase [Alkaliphilus flagellatus]MBU5677610.1 CCA tRNA nucleotidyltransferase [Alkaliphilus flagellatus]